MTDRIQNAIQITNEQLKAGGFAFQLPETATPEQQNEFSKLIEDTKQKGLNLVLSPTVKVIDLTVKPAEPVQTTVPQEQEKPVETKPVETPVEKVPETKPVEQVPVQTQTQQVPQVMPYNYVMGMPSWGQQIVPPTMPTVQPMMYPFVFPYSGIIPQQVPQQQTEKK